MAGQRLYTTRRGRNFQIMDGKTKIRGAVASLIFSARRPSALTRSICVADQPHADLPRLRRPLLLPAPPAVLALLRDFVWAGVYAGNPHPDEMDCPLRSWRCRLDTTSRGPAGGLGAGAATSRSVARVAAGERQATNRVASDCRLPAPTALAAVLSQSRQRPRALLPGGGAHGAACSLLQTFALAALLDGTSWLDAVLLRMRHGRTSYLEPSPECCILVIFAAEVSFGWVQVIGYFEVVAPNEWLSLNLFFDVLFHLGVAINEELSLRGWLFAASAQFFMSGTGVDAGWATILAVGAQSLVFAAAHAASPGASAVGLVNLTIGGVAAALNVVFCGLTFALGWHYRGTSSWAICSASPPPASQCRPSWCLSCRTRPRRSFTVGASDRSRATAPLAYLFGLLMLVFYGVTQGPVEWERRLSASGARRTLFPLLCRR